MKRMKQCRTMQVAGLCAALMLPGLASAITQVTVKVTLVAPPPCVINNDQPITVEFGDVMTRRVDGTNYRTPIDYALDCTGATNNAMTLTVTGTPMTGAPAALQTSKTGLGVKLQQGSNDLTINSPINFTYPNKPALFAVPVKQSGTTLTTGEFTAAATMSVAYQ